MSSRYKARRRIHVEIGSVANGLRTSTSSPPGYSVYDTVEGIELPEFYKEHREADLAAEKLNADLRDGAQG